MRILLSEEEQRLLDEASPHAERLFRQMRGSMDLRTRIAGRGAGRMSRAVLAIHCQYVPPRGSHNAAWKPSLRQIDVLIDELERIGLVKRCATPQEVKKLVVFFPAADTPEQVRPREERDMNVIDERDINVMAESLADKVFPVVAGGNERDMSERDERDISHSQINTDRDTAREEDSRGTPSLAVQLLVAARQLGVNVAHSANPEVQEWVALGVSLPLLAQGVAKARGYITDGRAVPAKYLTQVLRDLVREQSGVVSGQKPAKRPRLAAVGGRQVPSWMSMPDAEAHRAAAGQPPARVANGEVDHDWIE
ncbi:hypothetical protein NH8B_0972 [Pseudogulbenkiania sp. NH8B]|uniref:hypothetical protein n=1 Tax=Pseudogulbenkiania sp. (strain NH8B) TaxID=748280 RepID=UPI0002279A8A|nr:hypothetical protein [Pseudogulbenkiania sp. NH8B]BAK75804.1 hypothetical protein NH8B_0972 [Pseudogulbenkiania sp. NH8B]